MDNNVILEYKNVYYSYGAPSGGVKPQDKIDFSDGELKGYALKNCEFCLGRGEHVGLIGCNGAGKSTLLKLAVGLFAPTLGSINLAGYNVCRANLAAVRKKAGFVFQDAQNQLFMPTVGEDVAFGPSNYGVKDEKLKQTVEKTLDSLGILELKDRRITRLSGGEMKLASIATVLALDPELLIFDEPTIALDPGNRRRLINILRGLEQAELIASHDLDMIADVCDRVILIDKGRIAADGTAKEILTDAELLESCGLELPLRLQGGN